MGLRKERLADEIRDILGSQFSGGKMSDPRLENVTITAVRLTGDLQIAKVYFRIYGDAGKPEVARARAGMESASGFFRRRLADVLDIRRIPTLQFYFDTSIEHGSRIEGLLAGLKRDSDA